MRWKKNCEKEVETNGISNVLIEITTYLERQDLNLVMVIKNYGVVETSTNE